NNLEHIRNTYDNLTYRQRDAQNGNDDEVAQRVAAFTQQFITAMDDDINVQNGIATVYELVKYANVYAQK
ncbi:cysteine--tRNA ligase, partial [Roseburia hominis]|nr:cysteine--tRNA ligase [Roseburia hominis]